ncbi:MAG: hypothetical protein H7099_05595 [Gemmatimonadaceae bacterium]|nr:hypothetical protein [Gemmatimonadaceae bacterium]
MYRFNHRARLLLSLAAIGALTACTGRKTDPAPAPTPSVPSTPPAGATPAAAQPSVTAASGTEATSPSISLPTPPKVRADRQLLTRDAILATQYTNMYDVILALRGNWLRSRAAESIQGRSSTVQVYLDNQHLSGADELRAIAPTNIETVRYYDPIQASSRWGMDHGAGAIYILTAKR